MEIKEAIIIDDEPFVRDDLLHLLLKHPEIKVVGEAGSILEAKKLLASITPRIVFLDIQIRGGSGFDLVPLISPQSHIIFFTAHDEFAVRAFEVNALDYLLKPVDADRLALSLKKLDPEDHLGLKNKDKPGSPFRSDDHVFIQTDNEKRFVKINEIIAITTLGGNYTILWMDAGQSYTIRRTQKQWESMLPNDLFFRISRSSLICIERIETLKTGINNTCMVSLSGLPEPLEVSRRAAPQLKELVKNPN